MIAEPLAEHRIVFWLDVSSIVRHDWQFQRHRSASRLEYLDEICDDLRRLANQILPRWEIVIEGTWDAGLVQDFIEQGKHTDFNHSMIRHGFHSTSNSEIQADNVFLPMCEAAGAIVISRDRFWQDDYKRFRPWLWNGRRLVQPHRSSGTNQWTYRSYSDDQSRQTSLARVLVDMDPTFQTLIRSEGGEETDLVRIQEFCLARGFPLAFDDFVPAQHREEVGEAIRDAMRYRYRLDDLVTPEDITRTDAVSVLRSDGQTVVKVGDVLYVSESAKETLRTTRPRKAGLELFHDACRRQRPEILSRSVEELRRRNWDNQLEAAEELIVCIESKKTFSWERLSGGGVNAVRWAVDSLRGDGDSRRLASCLPRLLSMLTSDAVADVTIAKFIENRKSHSLAVVVRDLRSLPNDFDESQVVLWTTFEDLLVQRLIHDRDAFDWIDLSEVGERFHPGGPLSLISQTVLGSVDPIRSALKRGDQERLGLLVGLYFDRVLGMGWLPSDVQVAVASSEHGLTMLTEGQDAAIVQSAQVQEWVSGVESDLSPTDATDLALLSLICGRVEEIVAALEPLRSLSAEPEVWHVAR